MYLRQISTGDNIEILDPKEMFDPFQSSIRGRRHAGEEMQDPESFAKADLRFLSEEALPRCWTDPKYHSG
ncbi:MAG: acetyltransferase [Gammaproteobacteria bacterium]|nr:acetyltransferase [Gammaproteobacteria bacterium]